MERRNPYVWLAWLVALVVLLFGWPTMYRYDRFVRGPLELPMRINRFTGSAKCFWGAMPIEPNTPLYDRFLRETLRDTTATAIPAQRTGWSPICMY